MDSPREWIGAAEATAMLGIKRASLYSYASRGWVRSIPAPKGRARLYAREDLERLRIRHDARAGHAPVAAAALRFGEPVLDSRITRIDDDGPHVRGLSLVAAAAANTPFEQVAAHVLGTPTEARWCPSPARARTLGRVLADLRGAARAPTIELLPLVVAAAALPPNGNPDAAAVAHELVPLAIAMLALPSLPRTRALLQDDRPLAVRVLAAHEARSDRAATIAVDRALVLLCEHELNVGTFAVRIAASAGASLHACIGAGLGALGGWRHGRASDELTALVLAAGTPRKAEAIVAARIHEGAALPGFGHALYRHADPRALVLLATARELPRPRPALRTVLAIVDAAARLGAEPPNVDCGLVALLAALGLPLASASAIFAVARMVGWLAHAVEQREAGVLLRPRARYIGD